MATRTRKAAAKAVVVHTYDVQVRRVVEIEEVTTVRVQAVSPEAARDAAVLQAQKSDNPYSWKPDYRDVPEVTAEEAHLIEEK